MKRKIWLALFVILVLVSLVSTVEAARAIPASNESSTLGVEISASADGGLRARTDAVIQQGNGNLADNPPLANGEGQSTIVYQEHTMATSGSVDYNKDVYIDTGNQNEPTNNLDVTRSIDFSASSDGTPEGNMISTESVSVTDMSTSVDPTNSCCTWGTQDPNAVLPATNDVITAGSDVSISEGQVTSESSGRAIAASTETPVEMTYSVDVGPSGQTDDEKAQGTATAYVDVKTMEGGSGANGANQTQDIDYDQKTTVRGMITLAMEVSYSTA
jgi:hypothetical protein